MDTGLQRVPVVDEFDAANDHIPIIPASQIPQQIEQWTTLQTELQAKLMSEVEAKSQTGQGVARLASIRKTNEDLEIIKEKIANAQEKIASIPEQPVENFSAKDVAAEISRIDKLFWLSVTYADLIADPEPSNIVAWRDFGYFLFRVVQASILVKTDPTDRTRKITAWTLIAHELITGAGLGDYQGARVVSSALVSLAIEKQATTWHVLPKTTMRKLDEIVRIQSEAGPFDTVVPSLNALK